MKNILLYGVALLAASAAQAQTQTITFTTPQTLTAAGCPVAGVTTLTIDPSTASITTNGSQSCGNANGGGGATVVTVSASISGSPYTNQSGAAFPVISWSSSQPVTCSLPNAATLGFTYTAGANSFVLSTPPTVTAATNYNFTFSCSAPAGAAYTVTVVQPTVTLVVMPQQGSGQPPGCSPAQLSSTLGSVQLKRQCAGTASYSGNRFGQKAYSGNFINLSDVLGGGSWPNYITGYSFTPTITSGSFIALAFTPTTSGSIQFTTDPSFGDGGLISLSTTPGKFLPTDAGVLCSYGRGASNSLYINTTPGGYCAVQSGQTYYVNFAAADYAGNALCYPSNVSNSCASSVVSYSEIVGK